MLILGQSPHRLSIDIDIICRPGTDIEPYLRDIERFGFVSKTLEERQSRGANIPKSHSKFFYHIAYRDGANKGVLHLAGCAYEDCTICKPMKWKSFPHLLSILENH